MARARTSLTAISLANAKPKRRNGVPGATEVADGGCEHLYLVIHPTGRRVWCVRYRFGGRTRKLTLGSAVVVARGEPDPPNGLTLARARAEATAALAKVRQGIDPATQKAMAKAQLRSAA